MIRASGSIAEMAFDAARDAEAAERLAARLAKQHERSGLERQRIRARKVERRVSSLLWSLR